VECHDRAPTATFAQLAIPFAAVATDVASGREVVLRDGLVWRAVQASISVPGIFPPAVINNRLLVDGGLVNPVPTQTVKEMGADIVIGVDLSSSGRERDAAEAGGDRRPNLIELLWRSMEIMLGEITARSAATGDVTIRPDVGRSGLGDFSRKGDAFIAAGEEAAAAVLPDLHRLLPFVKAEEAV
jgi:NTE family protein